MSVAALRARRYLRLSLLQVLVILVCPVMSSLRMRKYTPAFICLAISSSSSTVGIAATSPAVALLGEIRNPSLSRESVQLQVVVPKEVRGVCDSRDSEAI